jgi:hypothetical protein
MPDPTKYDNQDDFMAVCVPKMLDEGKPQDQAVAACLNMWKRRGESSDEEAQMQQTDFTFTELTGELRAIDGMAAGSFTAMTGDKVIFRDEELGDYVANTKRIIESTRTEKGDVVGLAIDKDNHDHKGGAGWIKDVELDAARKVIRFFVDWTEEGMSLIRSNAKRFFSPSVIPSIKAILGGSLTNWPATRNEHGQILLRPVELSQQIKEIDMTKTLDELMQELEATNTLVSKLQTQLDAVTKRPATQTGEYITQEMQDFITNTDGAAELGREAQELAMSRIADERRKNDVKEFVAKIRGGTKEKPFGLPVNSSALAAALLALPDRQRKFIQDLVESTWMQAIDFAEHGYSSIGDISAGKPIPTEYKPLIQKWVTDGKTAASWFDEVMPELGKGSDFNLKEFAAPAKEA